MLAFFQMLAFGGQLVQLVKITGKARESTNEMFANKNISPLGVSKFAMMKIAISLPSLQVIPWLVWFPIIEGGERFLYRPTLIEDEAYFHAQAFFQRGMTTGMSVCTTAQK
jgi:hypothetical protein